MAKNVSSNCFQSCGAANLDDGSTNPSCAVCTALQNQVGTQCELGGSTFLSKGLLVACGKYRQADAACRNDCDLQVDVSQKPACLKQCGDENRENGILCAKLIGLNIENPTTSAPGSNKSRQSTTREENPTTSRPGPNKSRQSTTRKENSTTASPGVKSNNLDRFGLGPSFVTSDPSLPNQRGAGKAVQGGSSKAKTTTLSTQPTGAKPASIVDQKARIIEPQQQIK